MPLLDLVLPRRCPCGAELEPSGVVCAVCRSALRPAARLARPHPAPPGLPECAIGRWYEGALKRAVIAYKERGRRELSAVLAPLLAAAVSVLPRVRATLEAARGPVLLVPVPSSKAGWRQRGFDHVHLLTRWAVADLREGHPGRVHWLPLLEQVRTVGDQAGLSARSRRVNRAFSLQVTAGRALRVSAGGGVIVLVDDVLTTGATLGEGARALRAAGLGTVGCAAVAGVARES